MADDMTVTVLKRQGSHLAINVAGDFRRGEDDRKIIFRYRKLHIRPRYFGNGIAKRHLKLARRLKAHLDAVRCDHRQPDHALPTGDINTALMLLEGRDAARLLKGSVRVVRSISHVQTLFSEV